MTSERIFRINTSLLLSVNDTTTFYLNLEILWKARVNLEYKAQSQSIPKQPSNLFLAPLYTLSMAIRLSSQQQNSLLITKKERSSEIIENLVPMYRQYTLDKTLWSAVFKCNKRQSDLHANRVKESNFKKERLTTYDIYSPLIVRFVCVQSILPSYVA